jgi:hypothetical protein
VSEDTVTYAEVKVDWDATIARLKVELPATWTVTGYKGHATHDGVAWTASLRWSGKRVAVFEDAGRGGAVDVFFIDPDHAIRERNHKAWDKVVAEALPGEKFEPEAMVIEALLQRAGK